MKILITYNDEVVIASMDDDFKVSISSKDAGLEDRIHETCIDLDQCKQCGKWCSEDE